MKQMLQITAAFLMAILTFSTANGQETADRSIEISPGDTAVVVGEEFQFNAFLVTDSSRTDTTFTWQVSDSALASIDNEGNFSALSQGEVIVTVSLDSLNESVEVEIEEAEEESNEDRELRIVPNDTTIFVGEYVALKTQYLSSGGWIDTTATFAISDSTLARIESGDSLYALKPGKLMVTASLDSITAEAEIEIEEEDESGEGDQNLLISPSDTLVTVGAEVQFAVFRSSDFTEVTDSVKWSISSEIGTIDSTGKATFTATGFGFVDAEYNGSKGRASVRVEEDVDDSTGTQKIDIFVPKNNPARPPVEYNINEGEVFRLAGFASPLNYLNGGTVYFPKGSITEDIRIDISREDYTGTTEDGKRIVGGIGFDVFVNDSLISPYEFERPIEISIPFKRGLLRNLGIDIQNLGMYNLDDSGEVDTLGISSVTVDSVGGRIFGYVSHFSKYVLMPSNDVSTSAEEDIQTVPEGFTLAQNYPNPFNPTSTISFSIPVQTQVTLQVFNVLGQQVATLVKNKKLAAGWHSIQFDAGSLSSGVYIYRMSAGDLTLTKKMTLIK